MDPGTIEGECATLMAVLNLAVDMDHLDKNRLKRLPVPEYVKRERIVEGWELLKIREAASPNVWRLAIAALQIGLRENKLIEIHEEWLLQRGGGWWLVPSPGHTKIKGVPKMVPLNSLAYEALFGKTPRIGGRFFHHCKDGNSFKHTWMRTCERAGVHDLHFHDLRHTFTTRLTQCGGRLRCDPDVKRRTAAWFGEILHSQFERAIAGCSNTAGSVYEGGSKRGKRCSGASYCHLPAGQNL